MASIFAFIAGLIYAFVTGKNKSDKVKPTPEQLKRVNTFKWLFLLLFIFLLAVPTLFSTMFIGTTINYTAIGMIYLLFLPYIIGSGFLFFHFWRKYNTYAHAADSGTK